MPGRGPWRWLPDIGPQEPRCKLGSPPQQGGNATSPQPQGVRGAASPELLPAGGRNQASIMIFTIGAATVPP